MRPARRKTMVYLEENQFLLLKKVARASKKKISEIIREALSSYLKEEGKEKDYFSFVGIAEGPKKEKTSEKVEEILKEILK